MPSLYLISNHSYSGKSAVALGLAMEVRARGFKVGYMKPLGTVSMEVGGKQVDADAYFMQRTLKLKRPVEDLCPVMPSDDLRIAALEGEAPPVHLNVAKLHESIAAENDLVVLEGAATLSSGMTLGLAPAQVAAFTDSTAVLVIKTNHDLPADDVLMAKHLLQGRLAGVVVNGVPRSAASRIRQSFSHFLSRMGLSLFGVLPEDPLLTAMTVGELANLLGGHMLCCPEKRDELVQSFLVGAMGPEAAYRYFLRQSDKAVITGGDRGDIQMAALGAPGIKCLVLTGNLYPELTVVTRARELGVPIVLVPIDTFHTVTQVEEAWGHIRLSSPQQVDRLSEMVAREFDFAALLRALGLSK